MGRLYLRKCILDIIGQGGTTRISDLRVEFDVEKTIESTPNTGSLKIYNLSDTTRSLLEGKNTKVNIQVGYEDTFETVFIGDVTKASHDRQNVDIITNVDLADGDNAYRNSRFDKGYPKGAELKTVIDDLAKELKVTVGQLQDIKPEKFNFGLTLSGLIKDHLNTLTRPRKLEWSIQNQTLQITGQDNTLENVNIVLSPDTGLVGFPARTDKGVLFESLLQPTLNCGSQVTLESRVVSGSFKIRKVNHTGDNQRGTFLSKCEASAK